MFAASERMEFELAARLRDRLTSVRRAIEKQQIVAERNEDIDVIGMADDELEAAVQVFFVRQGSRRRPQGVHRRQGRGSHCIRARRSCARRHVRGRTSAWHPEARAGAVRSRRARAARVVAVRAARDPRSRSACRSAATSARCSRRSAATRKKSSPGTGCARATDHNARAQALNELRDHLDLPEAPLRIECFDMSHIQGSDYVGSMVVVEDGLAKKSDYRRFKIKHCRRQRRLRGDGRGAHAALHRLPRRHGQTGRRTQRQVLLSAAVAGRRRRQRPAGCGRTCAARARARRRDSRCARLPSSSKRCYLPGRSEPDALAPPVRGAVPAAAHPRRVAPFRHRVPPPVAQQAHDQAR